MIEVFGDDPKRELLSNPSVGEVHRKVSSLFALGKNDTARDLVRGVLQIRDPETGKLQTTGDLDDWFNLSAELGRNDEFNLGLKIALAGLAQQGVFPTNVVDTLNFNQIAVNKNVSPNVDLVAHVTCPPFVPRS